MKERRKVEGKEGGKKTKEKQREGGRVGGRGHTSMLPLDFCFPFHYDWEIQMRIGTAVMDGS